jgi:hypothetical protein
MIEVDAWGFAGLALDYALVFFFTIGALMLFIYFWWNRRLDFDECPKYQMLEEDDHYEPR